MSFIIYNGSERRVTVALVDGLTRCQAALFGE